MQRYARNTQHNCIILHAQTRGYVLPYLEAIYLCIIKAEQWYTARMCDATEDAHGCCLAGNQKNKIINY